MKQLWAYIRKNNLQDPSNKRKIICNDELRLVFETDCTDMFKMNKLLAKHIITLEPKSNSCCINFQYAKFIGLSAVANVLLSLSCTGSSQGLVVQSPDHNVESGRLHP